MPCSNPPLRARALRLLAFLVIFFAVSLPAFAQKTSAQPSRITQQVDESKLVTLARNTRPEANSKNDRGPVSDNFSVDHMFLLLQRSPAKEQELDKLIDSLNDKKSSNFHHWLTAEEFGQKFGVAQEDIEAVTNWLESHGFHVDKVYPSRILIDFSGTAGAIRDAFHTEIHQLDVAGVMHFANMGDPRIPAAVAPVVKGIASLNDFKPHPMYKTRLETQSSPCGSRATQPTPCYDITPQDNATIYNLNPLFGAGISGQGQTIVLVEDTDTYGTDPQGTSDWTTYRNTFGLTANFPLGSYTQVHPGCTDPGTNADDGEAAIDVEVASAIAPSAAIELISCASGTFTFGGQIALLNLINQTGTLPAIVSVSYGVCEAANGTGGNALFYNTYQQAASEGVSVFASSGDEGPSSCSNEFTPGSQYDITSLGVSGWSETPYNVSVGGTDFEDTYNVKEAAASFSTYWNSANSQYYGSAKQYVPEIPWNDACASALISEYVIGNFTTYGASPGFCNNSLGDATSNYRIAAAGSGGPSNCATGAAGVNQTNSLVTQPQCQGWPKPSWQSGSTLSGGKAVYGQPSDGVRDIPDISMFAANGIWGHSEIVCWSDPSYIGADGAASCAGVPSTWSGFGGTSVASPTMAGIQALVNQKTGEMWGNPNPIYYQIAQGEYGTAGGTFLGSSCNSSGSGGPGSGCAFNDVTQGDIDLACEDNGSAISAHCYKPAGTRGVDSTDNVTGATVINGGSGYASAPTCSIAGPSNNSAYKPNGVTQVWAGGTQAACTATVNSSSTTSVWSLVIESATAAGEPITVSNYNNSVSNTYTLTGATTAAICTALGASINGGSLATASTTACTASSTLTVTSSTAGYAGNINVSWGTGFLFAPGYVQITNTTIGQGPGYVSGITITTAGSGYQPETPITLTGGGGTGAIAVANTTPGTAAQSYQPAYGAAPGWDMATGLGTPNATNLVNSSAWLPAPGIYSPTPGSTLTGTTATFQWYGENFATAYALDLGSSYGGNNYFQGPHVSSSTLSQMVSNIPTNGGTVYVTWWYEVGGNWQYIEYTYGTSGPAVISSPTSGSMLTANQATFTWNAVAGATAYDLDIGTTTGGNNIYQSGSLPTSPTTLTVTGLPINGSTLNVTLFTLLNGQWQYNEYQYTAFAPAVISSPTSGSMLSGSSATFQWTDVGGATAYDLDIGTTYGGNNIYQSGSQSASTNQLTVNGLPTDGSLVYVTLFTQMSNGQWVFNEYSYNAFGSTGGAIGTITSPSPNTTLPGSTVTFTWQAGADTSQAYDIDVGSGQGGNNYYQSGSLSPSQLSQMISGLPTDGSAVWVTLFTEVNGQWLYNEYQYTAAGGGDSRRPASSRGEAVRKH